MFASTLELPRSLDEVPTPALLVDLDALDANIAKMTSYCRDQKRGLRPHGKTHKCPEIAKRLIRAGAVGTCAAKLSEAEVFAREGVRGILVTTAAIGRLKVARAVALASRQPDTIFSVDDAANVREISEAAAAMKGKALTVNVAIDLYIGNRTGIRPGEPALELARVISKLKNVKLVGLQAYAGHASHKQGFEARAQLSRDFMGQAVETRRLLERSGIACPMLTGGSTGTYNIDTKIDGTTEMQPGSFLFMDVDYSRIGGADGNAVYRDFQTSLTAITTVVSTPSGADVVVDGGFKAFSTDKPFPPEAIRVWRDGAPRPFGGVTFSWGGDEHGKLNMAQATSPLKVGDRVEFVVPHCDPTVNLHDRLYAHRGSRVEAVWPISARGMSQ